MFKDNMKALADKLIRKFGNTITINHKKNCHYDPNMGEEVCTVESYTVKASISNYVSAEFNENVLMDDLRVLITDEYLIDNISEFTVTYDNKTYTIINRFVTVTQDSTIVQELQIRL